CSKRNAIHEAHRSEGVRENRRLRHLSEAQSKTVLSAFWPVRKCRQAEGNSTFFPLTYPRGGIPLSARVPCCPLGGKPLARRLRFFSRSRVRRREAMGDENGCGDCRRRARGNCFRTVSLPSGDPLSPDRKGAVPALPHRRIPSRRVRQLPPDSGTGGGNERPPPPDQIRRDGLRPQWEECLLGSGQGLAGRNRSLRYVDLVGAAQRLRRNA